LKDKKLSNWEELKFKNSYKEITEEDVLEDKKTAKIEGKLIDTVVASPVHRSTKSRMRTHVRMRPSTSTAPKKTEVRMKKTRPEVQYTEAEFEQQGLLLEDVSPESEKKKARVLSPEEKKTARLKKRKKLLELVKGQKKEREKAERLEKKRTTVKRLWKNLKKVIRLKKKRTKVKRRGKKGPPAMIPLHRIKLESKKVVRGKAQVPVQKKGEREVIRQEVIEIERGRKNKKAKKSSGRRGRLFK